ncbi:U-box domain-containing protein 8 [Acorus calamus]|uniref:RING-type E3 ubiquitin transferase n=1 Tax=Acorus calamus TaxID=4465 RepID=A0AAV9FFI2_ACOCL|nr:U-box domain-containing protein 8 [Acorus calamus]
MEVMSDPVILSSGHTFDRTSIQRWLDSGNRTCPVTNLPSPLTPPSSPTTPSAIPRISRHLPSFRRQLIESGAASAVLRLVPHEDLAEAALKVVLDLSLDGDDARVGLVAEGAVATLVEALDGKSPAARALAATALTSLAVVEVNKATIGAHRPSAIGRLVGMLRCGGGRERREAATALYTLCSFAGNRVRAVEAGAVKEIYGLVGGGGGLDRAVEVLGLLGRCKEGRDQMEGIGGFVRVLVGVLREGSARAVEHALGALVSVCTYSDRLRLDACREGVLEACLELVGDENAKIAKNALKLIKTLQR